MSAQYMVSVCGSNAPSKVHDELCDAKGEALRLSMLAQNKDRTIHVVQICATLEPRSSHEWKN